MRKSIILLVLIVFFLFGWYSSNRYQKTLGELKNDYGEKDSPIDRINDKQILVYNGMVVLNVSGVEWAKYTDTNSMDPLLDDTANGLEIRPETEKDIGIGDVIVYKPEWTQGLLAHRVISISQDDRGTYYTVKGDNSESADPEKVRFNQISGVLVGVLY